jgi:hypothetical protein
MPDFIGHVLESNKFTLSIEVRTGNGFTGQMDIHDYGKYHVYLQVASYESKFPFRESNSNRYKDRLWTLESSGTRDFIPTLFLSRKEALVHTAAHELRHVWQHKTYPIWNRLSQEETNGQPHPGVGSDYDADRYAIRKQREWRQLHNKPAYG